MFCRLVNKYSYYPPITLNIFCYGPWDQDFYYSCHNMPSTQFTVSSFSLLILNTTPLHVALFEWRIYLIIHAYIFVNACLRHVDE